MENAIWKGKVIVASEIERDYEQEKLIRRASGHKELWCPDPDCKYPILKYCHGEVKAAFFAHLTNCLCDYAVFDRENTSLMREIKLKIYNSFHSRGYHVQMDVKILKRHYTHLLITLSDNSKIAVELGTQKMTANRLDNLMREYYDKGVSVKWLVISNAQNPVKESETFFIKRFQLNESVGKDVLILNWDGTLLTQYIEDKKEYLYNGRRISSKNYPDIYLENGNLDSLEIENGELTLQGFHNRFQKWLAKKEKAFQKRILELEECAKELRRKTEMMRSYTEIEKTKRRVLSQRQLTSVEDSRQDCACEEKSIQILTSESVFSHIDQQEVQVRDEYGHRWVKCEICGKIAPESEFSSYGGLNHINLGKCTACTRKKDN